MPDECKKNSLVEGLGEGNTGDPHTNCTYFKRNDCDLF